MQLPLVRSRRRALLVFAGITLAAGCAPELPPAPSVAPTPPPAPPPVIVEEAIPGVRLPNDTRPTAETLVLTVDPKQDRFTGTADIAITLDRLRTTIWLHGKGLHVTRATVTPEGGRELPATWKQRDESGMATLVIPEGVPAGHAKIHIEYDTAFGPKGEGIYKAKEAGTPYAYTQFEAIAARLAFPCFDEPGYKVSWDETLVVPSDVQAIANTHEVDRKAEGSNVRVHFAPTLALPSYLVAFAVGPFDIVTGPDSPPNAVRKRPLAIRAITTKGRGKEVAYALAHTGEILATLENYFGLEYPYDKLDILAVPDKGGAMENAGAVTFGDQLLLFDPATAPLRQRRAYAGVMAHELAHQWVGDLVTAAWWDDIWMNEAFATWVGNKATDLWDPTMDAATTLLSGAQNAMGEDGFVNARSIRQPITSTNDIENAFDSITYQKGGGVLSMFERWATPELFQKGLHDYLQQHSFGSGTADDFLAAESHAVGRDLKTPFHTFLDQPGVPFLEAEVKCDASAKSASLKVHQSRFLPIGSSGDSNKTWQIPACVRYGAGKETHEVCALITQKDQEIPLGKTCPDWVFPNANAAGYYRFSLAPKDLTKLRQKGLSALNGREHMAFANSLRAGYNRGTLPFKDALLAAATLANDTHAEVAGDPMTFLTTGRDWLDADAAARPRVEAYGRALFHGAYQRLGWERAKADDGDRIKLRTSVLSFLAITAKDPAVRAEAKKRGLAFIGYGKDGAIHRDAVDQNLVSVALAVVGEEADAPLWDAIKAQLAKTDEAQLRGWLLTALISAKKPELVDRVRALAFDPRLRTTEVSAPLWALMREPSQRHATWAWIKGNYDALVKAVPKHHGQTQLISIGGEICEEAQVNDVTAFFTPERMAQIDGGPRVLATTLESIHLCAEKRKVQEPSARAFFASH